MSYPAQWGTAQWGNSRWGILSVDRLGSTLLPGVYSMDVTRKKLVLGEADSVTGWYEKSYEDETIQMVIVTKAASNMALAAGAWVDEDAVGFTVDVVKVGDRIYDTTDRWYYEVKSVQPVKVGTKFKHRVVQLKKLPFGGL